MSVKGVVIERHYGIEDIIQLLPMYHDVNKIVYQYYYNKPVIDIESINDIVKGRSDINIENFNTCMKNLAIHGVSKMELRYVIDYNAIMDYLTSRDIICDTRIIYNEFKAHEHVGFVVISIIGTILPTIINTCYKNIPEKSYVSESFHQDTIVLYKVQSYQESSIFEACINAVDGVYTERTNVSGMVCMSYENGTYMKNHNGYITTTGCHNDGARHGMFSKKSSTHTMSVNYVNDIMVGNYTENNNGCITNVNYVDGKKYGIYSKKSTTIDIKANFIDDKLHGLFVKYINGILNGTYSKKSENYDVNANYVNGKLHGTYVGNIDGCITTVNYNGGTKHGAYSKKSPSHSIDATYSSGKLHDTYVENINGCVTTTYYSYGTKEEKL
jgi:hypothetical protein